MTETGKIRSITLWLASLLFVATATADDDFAFVHISDMHISPHPAKLASSPAVRGAACIEWIAGESGGPQPVGKKVQSAAPSFAIATGDLTEYGVIGQTWTDFERAFGSLSYPLYVLPGNHDNTWVAMYDVMRTKYGDQNYSFDRNGVHFVCLNSASPQEPVPTFDATTRSFLARDLAKTSPGTPIIVAFHHPPHSTEFANPIEYEMLIDTLRSHNVVLLLYGHGHGVSHKDFDGIDGVMGGSTFGKNSGYGVVSIKDGELRYAYHYMHDPKTPEGEKPKDKWRRLLKKPITRKAPKRLFEIAYPREHGSVKGDVAVVDLAIAFDRKSAEADGATVTFRLDGEPVEATQQPSVASDEAFHYAAQFSTADVKPGGHLLTAEAVLKDGRRDRRAVTFYRESDDRVVLWRNNTEAAIKAGPVIAGQRLILADTAGVVSASDRFTGQSQWTFQTGGEILGTPALVGPLVVFGSGDGKVYAVDDAGKKAWVYEAGAPVYSPPLVNDGVVYVGDNAGCVHAIEVDSGKRRWVFERADYAIETAPICWGDLIVFGAWDGYVYAVEIGSGKLAWKSLGPKSREGKAARYYAPADCSPVALGDSLLVCDRGYQLGTYDKQGEFVSLIGKKMAAVAPNLGGAGFYARSTDNIVRSFDASGATVWEAKVGAGRFPIPPTVAGDRVYVCSNTGLLSALDAKSGKTISDYKVTPGYYVMAPVAATEDGMCYVAGMDGSVTALDLRPRTDRGAGN